MMKAFHWLPTVLILFLSAALARAYPIILLQDDFDDRTGVPGSLFEDDRHVGQTGVWTNTFAATPERVLLQSDHANGGNALQLTKTATEGASAFFRPAAPNTIAPNTIATFSLDYSRLNTRNNFSAWLWIGGTGVTNSPMINVNSSGEWTARDFDLNTYVQPDPKYLAGTNGWTTMELVLSWGSENPDGTIPGTYDLYLTRTADNSLGALERTRVLSDLTINSNMFTTNSGYQIYIAANNWHLTDEDMIVYVDNVSLTVIPEPSVLLLLALGAFFAFRFRRR